MPMEELIDFDGVQFVRLRCCGRDQMYLAADEDGSGVGLLPDRRATANVLWSVQATKNADGETAVLLRGAYGLYLATSVLPATVRPRDAIAAVQRAMDDNSPPQPELMWQVVRKDGGFLIRNGFRRFLRGNGRHIAWRTAVTTTSGKHRISGIICEATQRPAESYKVTA